MVCIFVPDQLDLIVSMNERRCALYWIASAACIVERLCLYVELGEQLLARYRRTAEEQVFQGVGFRGRCSTAGHRIRSLEVRTGVD